RIDESIWIDDGKSVSIGCSAQAGRGFKRWAAVTGAVQRDDKSAYPRLKAHGHVKSVRSSTSVDDDRATARGRLRRPAVTGSGVQDGQRERCSSKHSLCRSQERLQTLGDRN